MHVQRLAVKIYSVRVPVPLGLGGARPEQEQTGREPPPICLSSARCEAMRHLLLVAVLLLWTAAASKPPLDTLGIPPQGFSGSVRARSLSSSPSRPFP
jgi:hypothetical protein